MKKKYFTLLAFILTLHSALSQMQLQATLDDATRVSGEGEGALYFAGTRDVNFRFSQRISPHGDCVDVVNGYAFVTWYKGSIANGRNLMLSRKNLNVPNAPWITIQFPHKHVGQGGELLRGTGIRGDSHNTAAIGISTIDNTIHILYDMHAYRASALPNDFFNYSVSKTNTAFVPDSEFTLDIFNPKQNYLRQGENYERVTYPMIHRAADGSLVARYRIGGSGNGDIRMAHYNGVQWTNNWLFQRGMQPVPDRNSLYGGERFLNGRFYAGYSIRYSTNNSSSTSNGFFLNSGLYFAYTNAIPTSQNAQWFDVNDRPISLPIRNRLDANADPVKIAEPGDDFGTSTLPRTSADPSWTVTENGAIHFITRVDNTNVHYYRGPGETSFSSNAGGLIPNPEVRGEIYSYKNHVYMVELIGGRVHIKTTLEGQNNWAIVYRGQENRIYDHFDAFVEGDKLYVYLMEDTRNNTPGEGDSRPIFFQEFSLSEVEIEEDIAPDLLIEAEAFTTASSSGVEIAPNPAASNAQIIGSFSSNAFIEYRFEVDTAGSYDFSLYAANRNRDDSIMDIEINGVLFENVLITRTFDWNVFLETEIQDVQLLAGENVVRLTQRRSLSSRPDRIEFSLNQTLNTTDVTTLNEDVIIHPNPSTGIFNIETSLVNPNYNVVNIQGQTVKRGILNTKQLNLSGYSRGVYFIALESGTKRLLKKVIIN